MSEAEILKNYPSLNAEDIKAAIQYASVLANEEIYPVRQRCERGKPMRFKIDENAPVELKTLLEKAGHVARTVFDQSLSGQSDTQIMDVCRDESLVLVTLDSDFSNIDRCGDEALGMFLVEKSGVVQRLMDDLCEERQKNRKASSQRATPT